MKGVVEAAGLKMDSVVYTQVYLVDVKNYDALNKIWSIVFSEESAGAFRGRGRKHADRHSDRDLCGRDHKGAVRKTRTSPRAASCDGAGKHGRAGRQSLLSGWNRRPRFREGRRAEDPKAQVDLMISRANEVLKAAKLEMRHLATATIYVDAKFPMEMLLKLLRRCHTQRDRKDIGQTDALPFGAHIEITGVASRDMKREGNCTSIGDTIYCPARTGSIQTALKYVNTDLEAARTSVENVVASNVFVDHIDNFTAMNKVYAGVFGKTPPTRPPFNLPRSRRRCRWPRQRMLPRRQTMGRRYNSRNRGALEDRLCQPYDSENGKWQQQCQSNQHDDRKLVSRRVSRMPDIDPGTARDFSGWL